MSEIHFKGLQHPEAGKTLAGAGDVPKMRFAPSSWHTRKRGASQAVFAQLVGVSKIHAQSCEHGVRKPSKLACRLPDEINRDPSHRRQMIGAA